MEAARRIGVQLLIAIVVAIASIYVPMTREIDKAELSTAMSALGWDTNDAPLFSPGMARVAFMILALIIAAIVYGSFAARRRAVLLVAGLAVVAVAVTHEEAKGIQSCFVVAAAFVGTMVLTVWHDRWLGGYIDD
jgi:hypothetical protein